MSVVRKTAYKILLRLLSVSQLCKHIFLSPQEIFVTPAINEETAMHRVLAIPFYIFKANHASLPSKLI